jgi:hypothetical protein
MTMYKTTAKWSGFNGAPGYTNFYFQGTGDGASAQAAADKAHGFFDRVKAIIPTGVTIHVEEEVELVDEVTGMMESVQNVTMPPEVPGMGGANYSGASGACITWLTGGVRNGRRVRGRTFLVPLHVGSYDTDGTLGSITSGIIRDAAAYLADPAGPQLIVWSRPSVSGAADGIGNWVTSYRVVDKAAVLTSRRD